MATHDYVIDNGTGAAVRTDLNNALAAIVSNNSSSSEPSTKYAYQWWADTTTGILKIRNSSNNGWVELLQLDGTLTLEDGSNSTPGLAFRDDLNTGIFSSAADTFDISCGGTTRGSFSSSGLTVTGNVTGTTFVGNIDAVDGDFDGTLEADAITVAGVALNTVIAGVTVTNATNAAHVSVADNESTNEENKIPFIEDASATGNVGLESDGDFSYNPSSGTVTATAFSGSGASLTGVNAATLDGVDSTQFVRADEADTIAGLMAMTEGVNFSATAQASAAISTLTDGSTITVDLTSGIHHSVTLGGNRTLSATNSGSAIGQSGSIFITQDGTGSRTLSYNSAYKFAGGTAPTLSTAANAIDRLDYIVKASGVIQAVLTLDVK